MKKLKPSEIEMLWGEDGPYSEAKIVINTRILDDRVSRVMIEVEGNINPTTFRIIKKHREEFAADPIITDLLRKATYRGKGYGYHIATSYTEFEGMESLEQAKEQVEYMKDAIIRMHEFVMDYLGIEGD